MASRFGITKAVFVVIIKKEKRFNILRMINGCLYAIMLPGNEYDRMMDIRAIEVALFFFGK